MEVTLEGAEVVNVDPDTLEDQDDENKFLESSFFLDESCSKYKFLILLLLWI